MPQGPYIFQTKVFGVQQKKLCSRAYRLSKVQKGLPSYSVQKVKLDGGWISTAVGVRLRHLHADPVILMVPYKLHTIVWTAIKSVAVSCSGLNEKLSATCRIINQRLTGSWPSAVITSTQVGAAPLVSRPKPAPSNAPGWSCPCAVTACLGLADQMQT